MQPSSCVFFFDKDLGVSNRTVRLGVVVLLVHLGESAKGAETRTSRQHVGIRRDLFLLSCCHNSKEHERGITEGSAREPTKR